MIGVNRRRVTVSRYKVLLTDDLYAVMKHFSPDGFSLFQDDLEEGISFRRMVFIFSSAVPEACRIRCQGALNLFW